MRIGLLLKLLPAYPLNDFFYSISLVLIPSLILSISSYLHIKSTVSIQPDILPLVRICPHVCHLPSIDSDAWRSKLLISQQSKPSLIISCLFSEDSLKKSGTKKYHSDFHVKNKLCCSYSCLLFNCTGIFCSAEFKNPSSYIHFSSSSFSKINGIRS